MSPTKWWFVTIIKSKFDLFLVVPPNPNGVEEIQKLDKYDKEASVLLESLNSDVMHLLILVMFVITKQSRKCIK